MPMMLTSPRPAPPALREEAPDLVYVSNVSHEPSRLEVPGLGSIRVDVAYGGMIYCIVNAEDAGVTLARDEARDLVALGADGVEDQRAIGNRRRTVDHFDQHARARLGAAVQSID